LQGALGGLGGGASLSEAGLSFSLLAFQASEGIRIGRHGGEFLLRRGEGLKVSVELGAQSLGGEALVAERRGGGAAFGVFLFQPGDFCLALLEAAQGLVEFCAGLPEADQVCLDGREVVFGLAERASGARLAGPSDDHLGGGGEAETKLLDDGIEFDPGETGADALANVGVVETGPEGRFTLSRPEETEKTPMLGLGGAAAG
jgi:hypothetical protein